ncbi:MAG TPA: alpha/beta fold hydrolase [Actinomycetota bacterium]|nr:alpha/beta fold hydrolase [Actinomycetota bacterium]
MTTVLLIHAFPLDASMWDEQVAALRGEGEVLAPSLPGFGGTGPVGDVLTMDAIADYLAEELDRAGAEQALVCGLSIGGYAAFSLWRRHQNRVAGLLLADTRAEADDEAGKERRRAVAEKARAEGSGPMAENPPPLLSERAEPALWERVKDVIRRQPGDAIAAASLGMAERPDSRPILPTINVPTTIVVGSADALTPPAMSEAMAEAIPDAELIVLEGAGHLSNMEDPERFLSALRKLAARVG